MDTLFAVQAERMDALAASMRDEAELATRVPAMPGSFVDHITVRPKARTPDAREIAARACRLSDARIRVAAEMRERLIDARWAAPRDLERWANMLEGQGGE